MVLRTTEEEVAPICKECSFGWNFYSYEILKRIKPKELIKNLLYTKLSFLFRRPWIWTIYNDVRSLMSWSSYMAKLEKKAKQARKDRQEAEAKVKQVTKPDCNKTQ